jgi:hypothetical protein
MFPVCTHGVLTRRKSCPHLISFDASALHSRHQRYTSSPGLGFARPERPMQRAVSSPSTCRSYKYCEVRRGAGGAGTGVAPRQENAEFTSTCTGSDISPRTVNPIALLRATQIPVGSARRLGGTGLVQDLYTDYLYDGCMRSRGRGCMAGAQAGRPLGATYIWRRKTCRPNCNRAPGNTRTVASVQRFKARAARCMLLI